jgi:hypothetical protein
MKHKLIEFFENTYSTFLQNYFKELVIISFVLTAVLLSIRRELFFSDSLNLTIIQCFIPVMLFGVVLMAQVLGFIWAYKAKMNNREVKL